MPVFSFLINRLRRFFKQGLSQTDPEKAYDLWAASYDAQPDNLMLALDEELFSQFLTEAPVANKIIVDIGCGTGRHWQKLLDRQPLSLRGYDVSVEMLEILKRKFPGQQVFHFMGYTLAETTSSCDLLISTLAMAHIDNPLRALSEWSRIVRPGGELFISDYHPDALAKGGNRTFRYNSELVAVKNYIHSIDHITGIAKQLGLTVLRITERKIDASVKAWYERQGALAVYEKFSGVPIIYGIHLKKNHAPT